MGTGKCGLREEDEYDRSYFQKPESGPGEGRKVLLLHSM